MDRSMLCILKDAHFKHHQRTIKALQHQGVPVIQYQGHNPSAFNDGHHKYNVIVISTELPDFVEKWAEKQADVVRKVSGGVNFTTDTHITWPDLKKLGNWVNNRFPEHHTILCDQLGLPNPDGEAYYQRRESGIE